MGSRPTSRMRPNDPHDKSTGRTRRLPAKASNPLPLILGVGGGALLLILVLAVALSGGDSRPKRKRTAAPPPAPAVEKKDRDVRDTGFIMFVCSNSPSHEDEEIVLPSTCPRCSKRSTYFWDTAAGGYVCFGCYKPYDNALIKCPKCGRAPQKTRLKHK